MLVKLTPVVNFTNILQAAFVLISLCQKMTNLNCEQIIAAQNTFVQKAASKVYVKLTHSLRLKRRKPIRKYKHRTSSLPE